MTREEFMLSQLREIAGYAQRIDRPFLKVLTSTALYYAENWEEHADVFGAEVD